MPILEAWKTKDKETVEESKQQTVGHTNPEPSRSNNQGVPLQEDEFGQYVSGDGFYQHVPASRSNTDRTREQLGLHQNIEAHAAEARPRQFSGYGPESRRSRPLTSRPVFSQASQPRDQPRQSSRQSNQSRGGRQERVPVRIQSGYGQARGLQSLRRSVPYAQGHQPDPSLAEVLGDEMVSFKQNDHARPTQPTVSPPCPLSLQIHFQT